MKKTIQMKPQFEAKLTTVGSQKGFALPVDIERDFELVKGRFYKVAIIEEIKSRTLFSGFSPLTLRNVSGVTNDFNISQYSQLEGDYNGFGRMVGT